MRKWGELLHDVETDVRLSESDVFTILQALEHLEQTRSLQGLQRLFEQRWETMKALREQTQNEAIGRLP
jgi:hypothetical protein